VVGGAQLLLRGEHDAADGAQNGLLQRRPEVRGGDLLAPLRGGQQRRLVDQVRQVGPDHAGRRRGHRLEVDVGGQRHRPRVDPQDLQPAAPVGGADRHPPVEPARPQQGRVQDLGPVRGGQHDHALVALEAVHLGEHLVERLLPLVDAAGGHGPAPRPADGVELVDEDDRGGHRLRLGEQVAHPAGADADDRLDELRGRDREERHPGLAGHRPGQQRLAGPGGPGQQHAAGDARAEPGVALRLAEEVDDLADLVLDLVDACHVRERRPRPGVRPVPGRR